MAHLLSEFTGTIASAIQASKQGTGNGSERGELSRFAARQSATCTALPKFSGSPDEWPAFIAVFRSTTTECGYSNAENAHRLQTCLKEPAKEAVRLMLAIPDNVELALRTLEQRFGRPKLVVGELITQAKQFRPIKRSDDMEGLINFSAAVFIR
eukprot:scpid109263/ scgid12755/ 